MAKNIVLLSDGTGNSSAQLMKTNVWRIYEALQLTDPTVQVACYDDGVGTSSFKPLAIAGGAFGVGLRRNALRLYRFLCEHYDPGDRIYLFGFSRGAFTVRVLAGLICDQGIIRTRPTIPVPGTATLPISSLPGAQKTVHGSTTAVVDEAAAFEGLAYGRELARLANWAYRDFRRHFHQSGPFVAAARAVRNAAIGGFERATGKPAYNKQDNHQVDAIEFIGVWDTVDAYGLPVDELTDGVDRWIWPLSMPELTLHAKVKRACHVLALDDERNTFHPVLWDESKELAQRDAVNVRDERVSQVWFAGMHSNVGGGYPDDALSYVSLKWMAEQAGERSLLFVPELLAHHTKKADPFGRIYDSRQGLKGYYRYNPRRMQWLTDGQTHEHGWAKPTVETPRPKIHESVLKRIASAPEAYAPIVFPRDYAVVLEDGSIVHGDRNPYEPSEAARRRTMAQEKAWDLVWQRRAVYFAAVFATIYLLVLPLRDPVPASATIELGIVAKAIGLVASFLPGMFAPWVRYYQANPYEFGIGLGVLFALMRLGRFLQGRICGTMRGTWLKVMPPAREEWRTLPRSRSTLTKVRSNTAYQIALALLRRKVLPNFFGIAILIILIGVVNRVPFELAQSFGWWGCRSTGAPLAAVAGQKVQFASTAFCSNTGIRLERGARYRIEFTDGLPADWKDGDITVPSQAGLTPGSPGLSIVQRGIFTVFAPFRRLWSQMWFVPIARIGATGVDHYPLSKPRNEFTAQSDGELFLFVNDAILPIGVKPFALGWGAYYQNNSGTAAVTVTKLSDPPAAAQ